MSPAPKILSPSQVERYRQDGFAFPVPVLTADEVRELRADLEYWERLQGHPLDFPEKSKSYLLYKWADTLVHHPRVLDAVRRTLRHEFVAEPHRKNAYFDMAFPIGEHQTISSPFIVAYMTQSLDPQPTDKVLEIGTGSGYQAAVLARLGARVFTIERHMELLVEARARFDRFGIESIASDKMRLAGLCGLLAVGSDERRREHRGIAHHCRQGGRGQSQEATRGVDFQRSLFVR